MDVLERASRVERHFFDPARPRTSGPRWHPPVDVFETDEDLWVFVALPGVDPRSVEVVLEGATLGVRGERSMPAQAQGAFLHRLEIPQGRFERRIELPSGGFRVGPWELAQGCLVLRLLKG